MVLATQAPQTPELGQQAAKLLGLYAGYSGTWTIELGLRTGLFRAVAAQTLGLTSDELATQQGLDHLYVGVWCRAAYSVGLLDFAESGRYVLAPHMNTLLLDPDAPSYLGGVGRVFVAMRETFTDLREFVKTGQHEWWSDFDPEWISAVSDTGQAFYRRLLNLVVPQLPSVEASLRDGGRVLDLACGMCLGPIKIARAYPTTTITAVDGDAYTLEQARDTLVEHNLAERFELVHSPLEELRLRDTYDVAIINISLHEARDIERVVSNARTALRDGGTFLVSEFPFPETVEACRALPAQIMCGIQYFEAHIGCQLLPTSRFVELLKHAGFRDVGVIEVTPVHAVIHGTK